MAMIAVMLAGCAPVPTPTPTPTAAFASKEEAFAAAEETYRAYTDALNDVDPADPATFEATYEFSSGSVRTADRENFSEMHAEGQTIEGDADVSLVVGQEATAPYSLIVSIICVDVRDVVIRDAAGASIVNPNRPDVYQIEATFKADSGRLFLDGIRPIEGSTCEGP